MVTDLTLNSFLPIHLVLLPNDYRKLLTGFLGYFKASRRTENKKLPFPSKIGDGTKKV